MVSVVVDGTSLYLMRCIATYVIDTTNPNDRCCPETPLQGSYYCSHHFGESNTQIEYDGLFFMVVSFLNLADFSIFEFIYKI